MILRDALDIRRGTAQRNKIYKGTYKVWDRNKKVLEGYCKQNTTKGKQLLKSIATTDISQGVEFIQNKNGTVTINGKNNGTGNSYFHLGNITLPAGTYYGIKNQERVQLVVYVAGKYYDLSEVNFTLAEQKTTTDIYLQIKNNQKTYDNFIFYPMIANQNITIDDFEPYTGGQPSPNPDYPQEIEVMQGRQVVPIQKNRFDKDTIQRGSLTNQNGKLVISDVSSTTRANNYNNPRSIQASKEYTIKCANGYNYGYFEVDDEMNIITDSGWKTTETTFIAKANATKIIFHLRLSESAVISDIDNFKNNIGLQLISNEQYTVDLKSKNEFDGEIELGRYYIDTGKPQAADTTYRNKNPIKVEPNTTYTFSINSEKTSLVIRYFFYDSNMKLLRTDLFSNGNFTTIENCYYMNWHSTALKENYADGVPNPMIEKGSVATLYEPYYDYKLAGIGDVKDNIYTDKGGWYFEKKFYNKKFDGSETFTEAFDVLWGTNVYINTAVYDSKAWGKSIANYFRDAKISSITPLTENGQMQIVQDNSIIFKNDDITTAQDFKTWLSTHNTDVWYELGTAQKITIPSTYTTLINQLNTLYQAM